MSYLDDEIINDLKKMNVKFSIPPEAEHDLIVELINENIPFSGNQIAWSLLKENTYIGPSSSHVTLEKLEKIIKSTTERNVIFIGDATDNAYSITTSDLMHSLQLFSKTPQHTYILQKQLDWIACISFEGDVDFAKR
ncbi:hypothetical protein [Pseudomonas sp. MWU15-20650]|uniref:hypothetical protein n=1 Tax=Pseudomonas sp. MWU15-20650 TaxID=2933107 RepID=UPI00200BF4DE|nr:hypothetical protein [Pseudomonas sp. MWU15-20650]